MAKTIFNMADGILTPCNVAGGFGMTCHWIRPNVRNIGILHNMSYYDFVFDHITAVDMSFCTSLRNFIQIGPTSAEKMTSCRFSRWRISAILDFRGPIIGSLKSPCATSYRSSIDTIALNYLVFFRKSRFFAFWRKTDEQMDSTDALSRSRCRERRLHKRTWWILSCFFSRTVSYARRSTWREDGVDGDLVSATERMRLGW